MALKVADWTVHSTVRHGHYSRCWRPNDLRSSQSIVTSSASSTASASAVLLQSIAQMVFTFFILSISTMKLNYWKFCLLHPIESRTNDFVGATSTSAAAVGFSAAPIIEFVTTCYILLLLLFLLAALTSSSSLRARSAMAITQQQRSSFFIIIFFSTLFFFYS